MYNAVPNSVRKFNMNKNQTFYERSLQSHTEAKSLDFWRGKDECLNIRPC